MEMREQFNITPGGRDVVNIARYLSRDLSAQEKSDAVSSLKAYLLDNSYGSESDRAGWLKSIFCEAPLLDAALDADKAITLFTLLLTKLYPDIEEGPLTCLRSRLTSGKALAQQRWKTNPDYRLVKQEGPPHARVFTVEVAIAGKVSGAGQGTCKRDAQQAAARQALQNMPSAGTGT